jgi:Leucine-rich repeat (LRR) protein
MILPKRLVLIAALLLIGALSGRAASQTSAPAAADAPAKAFEMKWGHLQIHALPPDAVSAINALPATQRAQVAIRKSCTQADFDRIQGIEDIESLAISHNPLIHSLAPLASLTGLRKLTLYRMKAAGDAPLDLTPLAALVNLEELDCSGTEVTNTKALTGLARLKRIKFYMSAVASLDFLSGTPLVEELDLYGDKHTFKDYQPLLALQALKRLNIYMNTTATDALLAPLVALETLEEISMSNCKAVTTLDFLKHARGLIEVKASQCNMLADISALSDKALLRDVAIDDAIVTDFASLQNKPKLLSLDVSGTAFADLTLLSACTKLQSLELQGTPLRDFAPLGALKALRRLTISKNVPESKDAALLQALPELHIRRR